MVDNTPDTERLRVAVVGLGIGREHLRAYRSLPERYELMAVCDLNAEKANIVGDEFNVPQRYTDLEQVLQRDDIDVVDICTPPGLHYRQITETIAAHKHVICEKPLVGSLKEADDLLRLEGQTDQRVMPIFQYRFGHGLQKLRYLQARGITGQAYTTTVETAWRRRASYYDVPWRGKWATELGGALLGHAIHAHDMLYYVLGPARQVFAYADTRVNRIEVEDCAAAALRMADGSMAALTVTLGSSAEISRHRFCFANLSAESNTRPYTSSGDPWEFAPDTPEVAAQMAQALAEYVPQPEHFAGQLARFYDVLRRGGPLPVTLADARNSLELVTALYSSARTNMPVDLPIGPDDPGYEGWLPG